MTIYTTIYNTIDKIETKSNFKIFYVTPFQNSVKEVNSN